METIRASIKRETESTQAKRKRTESLLSSRRRDGTVEQVRSETFMATRRIYLDHNATAPIRAEARAAMHAVLDETGNASSVHGEGRRARAIIETARNEIAALVGVKADGITFTSGGTEANHLALAQAAPRGATAILISSIEHLALSEAAAKAATETGLPLISVPVTQAGLVDLDAFENAFGQAGDKPFVSIMSANNETGVIQPIAQIAAHVHEAGGLFHVDASQSPGKMPFSLSELGVDLATLSAHKMGGPQGVGALVQREDAQIVARQTGGGQERGRRSGTENLIGIAGFGAAAAALARLDLNVAIADMASRRALLEEKLLAAHDGTLIFGKDVERLSNTISFAAPMMRAETLLMQFDLAGFALSAGSACSSGKVARSHVLEAMGVEENLATGALRVSFGMETTEEELDLFAAAWREIASRGTQKTKVATQIAAKG